MKIVRVENKSLLKSWMWYKFNKNRQKRRSSWPCFRLAR